MKILFSARPAYGHVFPLLPLALAARDAGHDVRFATAGTFVSKLALLGLPTFAAGPTIDEAFAELTAIHGDGMPRSDDGRPDLAAGGVLFLDLMGHRTAADLGPILDAFAPDLVIYEQGEYGAAVTAHARGIPAVLHSLSPRMPRHLLDIVDGGRVERLWDAVGVADPALDVFTGDVFVDIFPTRLQEPSFVSDPARIAIRPVPFTEPTAPLPTWIGGGERPLVYLTLGTIVGTDDVLRPAIDGASQLDADVLVALGSAAGDDLGPLPANVRVASFVDQRRVLRHADLAVHHGGSGTILAALAAGTPQLLLPKGADQFQNADTMAATGLAAVLEPNDATPAAIAAAALTSLGRLSTAAAEVQAEIAAMPHPAHALAGLLERVESVAGRRRAA